jgi:GTP-binding protein HflX
MKRTEEILESTMVLIDALIPYEQGALVDLFHRRGLIQLEEHTAKGTRIVGRMPRELAGQFQVVRTATQGS